MQTNHQPLSRQEFDAIYSMVPRLTVELVITNHAGELFLAKRAIEPCKGRWHLPGGTVRFAEPLITAVQRIAERELGIRVQQTVSIGIIEYPSHYLHGLDDPVGIVYKIQVFQGNIHSNQEASSSGWFRECPHDMHADQDIFLIEHGFLQAAVQPDR